MTKKSKSIFQKIPSIKSKDARQELARAHAMVAMLSLALIALLLAGTVNRISFDGWMTSVAMVLLAFVSIFSFIIAFRFRK